MADPDIQQQPTNSIRERQNRDRAPNPTRGLRIAIFVLGLAAVITGVLVWLVPTPKSTTTASDNSTTASTDPLGRRSTAVVDRTTTTTSTPGASRSGAPLVALLTAGIGLLLLAGLWDRIQEFGFGGISIKLIDAVVPNSGIALVDAVAAHVDSPYSTTVDELAKQINEIAERGVGVARVDIRRGDLWAPLNLGLFVLMLAYRTNAQVIVFTGDAEFGQGTYIGTGDVARLADRIAANDPDLAAAHRAIVTIPLDRPMEKGLGNRFYESLPRHEERQRQGKVDAHALRLLTGPTLITRSVPAEHERTMSKQQQRAILKFPLAYVPIAENGKLDSIVNKPRLAEEIALSAVGQ